MDLILIEGLPGSGKSTMAEMLCKKANCAGFSSSFFLEELKDHPIHPIEIKYDKYAQHFPERCLKQWERFVSENQAKDHLYILEGSLFQSTVRFMLEGMNKGLIDTYYHECQLILTQVRSQILYLRPIDSEVHIKWIMEHRGEEWTSRVAAYLEKTPYCSERQWHGERAMVSFWSDYAQLCDSLVQQTFIPYQTVAAGNGRFDTQFSKANRFVNLKG